MKNNKGYTLIEILAVITIISVIAILGVTGYSRYIDYTKIKAYDTMAKSASNAASEYVMDNIGIESVTFEDLTEYEYLEYPQDPSEKRKACKGKVDITYISGSDDELDTEEYTVYVCCANYTYKYEFPGGQKYKLARCPVE